MKLLHSLFSCCLHEAKLDVSPIIECPNVQGERATFRLAEPTIVTLKNAAGLCTLSLSTSESKYIPVARSYDGNSWERSGGMFAQELEEWQCSDDGVCIATLPIGDYSIQNRVLVQPTAAETWARFLESTTFGPTINDVRNPPSGNSEAAMVQFIRDQINEPPTSHREFYRRRLNPLHHYHHPTVSTRSNPCSIRSLWTRQFLSIRDFKKDIVLSAAGNNRTRITVDGEHRATVQNFRYQTNNRLRPVEMGTYLLCLPVHSMRYGRVRIRPADDKKCIFLEPDDLHVDFDAYPRLVLEDNAGGDIGNAAKWKPLVAYKGAPETYQRVAEFQSQQCNYPSSPTAPPLPNLVTNFTNDNRVPAIFHRTDDGVWLMYRPTPALLSNTLSRPHPTGALGELQAGRLQYCTNVPRSYQNEATCIQSPGTMCIQSWSGRYSTQEGGLVCGSPNEVPNDPSFGDRWLDIRSIANEDRSEDYGVPEDVPLLYDRQRELVWYRVAVSSPDQLRQRVAWALKQIFSLPKIAIVNEMDSTEAFLNYYDIFVRHAFGNYRDVLKEITHHPLMAMSLSYLQSKSVAAEYFSKGGTLTHPDENFARELMQLFTIGLVELHPDGTPVMDGTSTIPTYNSDDIANFARAWTGLAGHPKRANMENSLKNRNLMDPLFIRSEDRDRFPKTDLEGGYIGDGYPLCSDLPQKPYLRVGAKYRLLGKRAIPETIQDAAWTSSAKRLVLDPSSQLYQQLCASNNGGSSCTYPAVVVLERNVACPECNADQVRVVQVAGSYYEHVPVPCVEFPFFEEGKVVRKPNGRRPVCANPYTTVGSEACCNENRVASPRCDFGGERMTYATASQRCFDVGQSLCTFSRFEATSECPHEGYHWTPEDCRPGLRINRKGQIAVFHDMEKQDENVGPDSPSFFGVQWENNQYPNVDSNCGGVSSCQVVGDTCSCDVTVTQAPVFRTVPKSAAEIANSLNVGFPDLSMFNRRAFQAQNQGDFQIFSPDGSCCGPDTVFGVTVNGVAKLYRNVEQRVTFQDSTFSFRNPPSFNNIIPSEFGNRYSAEHETDAVLDYVFYHKNAAPFVAYRLIQRLGVSNPSPTYVGSVADAFRLGVARVDGEQIGSGKYGDLAATVAQAVMHSEARSPRILSDPVAGSLREPILKVLGLMRAMEMGSSVPLLDLDLMETKVGQAPYEQPSVFNFFRPEYSSPGLASSAKLVVPEAEVMSAGRVVGLLNGMFSAFDDGLIRCDSGFGSAGCPENKNLWDSEGDVNSGNFLLNLQTNSHQKIVSELALLLTCGRLSADKQRLLESVIGGVSNPTLATNTVAKYILTTPEFHTTSATSAAVEEKREEIAAPEAPRPNNNDYKAVIHIALRGGCDSYNMLVPHTSCSLHSNYKNVRGEIALDDSMILPVDSSPGQPCSKFGVHKGLQRIKSLYDEGQLMFIANAGMMTEPVNKDNYLQTSVNLFAHNSMQDEVDVLDPQGAYDGTGTLGRMADKLEERGYRVSRTAVEAAPKSLSGEDAIGSPVFTLDESGATPFDVSLSNPTATGVINELNGGGQNGKASGIHGEIWSTTLAQSVNQSDALFHSLQAYSDTTVEFDGTRISNRLKLVSQLIKARSERGVDRDFFFVTMEGYDHHGNIGGLETNFRELDRAMQDLIAEIGPEVWKDVVVVQTSDFGRTLTPNTSGGSDHGWGGNYWVAGGSVRGKQIKGSYPTTFSENGPLNIGRGRLIPTTPFDASFNGIAGWTGLGNQRELDFVLPNRNKFSNLFTANDMFTSA